MLRENFFVFLVEINYFCSDFLSDFQCIRRFLNVLSGDLGNMKQSIYARLKLNECTKVSHTGNTAFYYVAYSVFVSSVQPRILFREF